MPGVRIPDNSIVAAGSVVTKTVVNHLTNNAPQDEGIIIGGNPAVYICKTNDFLKKRKNNFLKLHGLSLTDRKNIIMNNKEKWINK